MATRANIVVKFQSWNNPKKFKKVCWIYNHWDGYIEDGLGDALVKAFKSHPDLSDRTVLTILGGMLSNWNFEFTDGQHGDIEYLYEIKAKRAGYSGHSAGIKITELFNNKILLDYVKKEEGR